MITPVQSSPKATQAEIGGTVHQYRWQWQQQQYTVVYETLGSGTPVLLLPAFSTVSTRGETRGIAQLLSSQYQVTALDWLGFGESDRPSLPYQPQIYHQLLEDFVKSVFNSPIIIIAMGHSAGYVLRLAQKLPQAISKIVLVAPTWRAPLRTMEVAEGVATTVRQIVRTPIVGQILYQLNTTPSFLRLMYGRHVYLDRQKLTPEFIAQKREITQQPGARFGPAAFVTGAIDPVTNRTDFLAYLESLSVPVLVIVAEQAPPKSKAEMEAMISLPSVQGIRLAGTLGIHEEYAAEVSAAILDFLHAPSN